MVGQTNALLGPPARSLDEQLRSLVIKYGADAVRDAAKRATAKRKGRKPEQDWMFLWPWIEKDADDWLHGREPTDIRSNYSIAKAFAQEHPGHNQFATKERIERKLREKRRYYMLTKAWQLAETEFPAETYVRCLRELAQMRPDQSWGTLLEFALGKITRYREKFGEPAPEKSLDTIEDELQKASATILSDLVPRGLFGNARRVRKPVGYSNPRDS